MEDRVEMTSAPEIGLEDRLELERVKHPPQDTSYARGVNVERLGYAANCWKIIIGVLLCPCNAY